MEISTLSIVIAVLFLVTLIVQVTYYLAVFSRTASHPSPANKRKKPFVSVIICARDEAVNLEKNLPSVLEQDYPSYEVIVVNDASVDHSDEVLQRLSAKYRHLHVTTIQKDRKFTHGKKLAVLVGVKAAKNEYLIFTDADCKPSSDQWIKMISRHFTASVSFVLGYGKYRKKRGLLNNYIRYDTFFIALQYLGFARNGKPYMGVGRNMAYRKEVFFKNNGFGNHASLLSGDDDLLVNAQASGKNTKIESDPSAHTISEPPRNWGEWLKKKRRHLTTAKYYRKRSLFMVGGELISRILFYISFAAWLIFDPLHGPLSLISGGLLFFIRWLIMLIIFKAGISRLQEKQILLSSLFYDILSPILYLLIWMSNLFSTKKEAWK